MLSAVAYLGEEQRALAAAPPATWDNLTRVDSKRLKYVYLLPDADFSPYTKVMLDPVEVAFEKNWRRDYNRDIRDPGRRISDSDLQETTAEASEAAHGLLAKAFEAGGYPVVTTPGPDVLRVRVGVLNISVAAPDKLTAGRVRTFSTEAGSATLYVEARDSVSNALLGRAVDARRVGDNMLRLESRSSVSNRADFRRLLSDWAKNSVNGLNELWQNSKSTN
jgi:hypothetical protein